MRFWTIDGTNTFAATGDELDLAVLEPDVGWVELDETAYDAAVGGGAGESVVSGSSVTVALSGNGQHHTTAAGAKRVSVYVVSPTNAPVRARPTINGAPVLGGGAPFVYQDPSIPIRVETRAGNNEVVIIEEF